MDFLGKERERNVAPRGSVNSEVKVAVQSYDWSDPIMVFEQRDCGSGMESHPDGMSAEVAEGISRG